MTNISIDRWQTVIALVTPLGSIKMYNGYCKRQSFRAIIELNGTPLDVIKVRDRLITFLQQNDILLTNCFWAWIILSPIIPSTTFFIGTTITIVMFRTLGLGKADEEWHWSNLYIQFYQPWYNYFQNLVGYYLPTSTIPTR